MDRSCLRLMFIVFWMLFRRSLGYCDDLELKPVENPLFVGDKLELNCTTPVPDGSIKMSEVYFSVYDQRLVSNETFEIKQINDNTLRLTIQNVSLNHAGRYYCSNNDTLCPSWVGVKNRNVAVNESTFECVFIFTESLACKWQRPANTHDTQYNLTEMRDDPEQYAAQCTYVECDDEKPCFCALKPALVTLPKLGSVFKLNLTWQDFDEQLYNQTFVFPRDEIIKLHMPIRLEYNQTTGLLKWQDDLSVSAHSASHPDWMRRLEARQGDHVECSENLDFNVHSYNLSDLHLKPNHEYNISIQIKSRNINNVHWSNVVHSSTGKSKFNEITIMVPKKIPTVPPNITAGAFEAVLSALGNTRAIILFWSDVPKSDWNDDFVTFDIDYRDLGDEKQAMKMITNVSDTHYRLKDLAVERDYKFRIYSSNSLGRSSTYSSLLVPKQNELHAKVHNVGVIKRQGGSTMVDQPEDDHKQPKMEADEVLWLAPKNTALRAHQSYTVFWCHGGASGMCQGGLRWQTGITQNVTLNLPARDYHFGVALVGPGHFSSGIEWAEASCVVDDMNRLGTRHRGRLRLELLKTGRDWLLIGVTDVCLSLRETSIRDFMIQYCLGPEKKAECRTSTFASSWLEQARLDGLVPWREYHITVSALGHGKETIASDSLTAFTSFELAASRTMVQAVEENGPNNYTIVITSKTKTREHVDRFKVVHQNQSFNCSVENSCQDNQVLEDNDKKVERPRTMTCHCVAYSQSKPLLADIRVFACSKATPDCWMEGSAFPVDDHASIWRWIVLPLLIMLAIILLAMLVYLRVKHLQVLKAKAKAFTIPTLADRSLSATELDGIFREGGGLDDNPYGFYHQEELNGLVGTNPTSLADNIDLGFDESFERNGSASSKSSKNALLGNGKSENKNSTGISNGKHYHNSSTELSTFKVEYKKNNDGAQKPLEVKEETSKVPAPLMRTANVTGSYVSPQMLMNRFPASSQSSQPSSSQLRTTSTMV